MKVDDFIIEVGHVLQEDFTYAPLWTKAELLKYVQKTVDEFAEKTLMVDAPYISLVGGATGEATVPQRFRSCYYNKYNDQPVDLVNISELDFVSQTWTTAATATTPLAATVYGAGDNAVVRYVPRPNTGLSITSVVIADTGGNAWTVTVTTGALVTTAGGTASTVLVPGTSQAWTLGATLLGALTTTAAGVVPTNTIVLTDSDGSGNLWELTCTADGVLVTTQFKYYGTVVWLTVDGVDQVFTSGSGVTSVNYGILVDMYATGTSTTPSYTGRLSDPYGTTNIVRGSSFAADLWCKLGSFQTLTLESLMPVSTAFLPVIKHGVLALAYSKPFEGRDSVKAKLLRTIFVAECETLKRIYGRR